MKRSFLFLVLAAILFNNSNAQQLKTPAASPTQNLKQDFGIGSIELSYSRPSLKGRKYFEANSELAPVGKVWRTGANGATTITFSDDVKIGGVDVKAGKYGLLSIPGKDEWTLIITAQTDVTNPNDYNQEKDVVRVKTKPLALGISIENFTIQFGNITPVSCDLQLMWGTTAVSTTISTEIDSKIMAQIDKLVKSDNRPYFNAASYYVNNNKDLNQALAWFDKAIEQTPNGYWIYYEKANCLLKMGKKAEAKVAAQKSLELAKASKDDAYIGRNEKLLSTL
ncbi:MAG: DUF2911 domain-containing protein [Sphingobacteriales bacterium]|nr:MAG: DUF2911 domain-containing protein [Sphingobacteriales bacterium]